MNQIKWQKKALKQLRKIKNIRTRNRIYDAVDTLRHFPDCRNAKKLVDREEYRLRVGNWRVFFTADLNIIYIEEVKKRNETTY
jgi:mRNA-degrading endonuclease RelE of RelBE toxin-antitoxin system